jgi:heme/copper-type cytochrome/quinol oxidase subunit 4
MFYLEMDAYTQNCNRLNGKGNPNHIVTFMHKVVLTVITFYQVIITGFIESHGLSMRYFI